LLQVQCQGTADSVCSRLQVPGFPSCAFASAQSAFAAGQWALSLRFTPTGVLVNVGRGPVIDEPALVRALREKRIRGAALDVFEKEPLPDGHPLYGLDNLLLSPHCADNTPGWLEAAMRAFVRNLERFRRGEPLENVVDKALGY
jgi:phosphoglycerate dehydrogenase-like enzyme